MEPTDEMIDSIYREKVERAIRTPLEEKLRDGARLFTYACEIMRMGIRAQHPGLSPEEVEQKLHERFEIGRHLEEFSL